MVAIAGSTHVRTTSSFTSPFQGQPLPSSLPCSLSTGPKNRLSLSRSVTRAGKCPFGFHGDALKEERAHQRLEAGALLEPPTKGRFETPSPYSPAPSLAPDAMPIGPGNYEYLPFKTPYKMVMGLEPFEEREWIEIDMFYEEEMAIRTVLLDTRKDTVIDRIPTREVRAAEEELLEMLVDYLPKRFPEYFERDGDIFVNRVTAARFDLTDKSLDPMEVCSRLVQEDLCLMFDVNGTSEFVSGAVLFPQRWSLLEKMGMDMGGIHKPVPLFAEEINKPVNAFMTRLKVGKPWMRSNWAIVDDPTMFQPLLEEDVYALRAGRLKTYEIPLTIDNAGDRLLTRCERETFVRLPRTNATLFTIRTYMKPLRVFRHRPELAAEFVRAIDALPDEVIDYKDMRSHLPAGRAFLEKCAKGDFMEVAA